MQVDVKRIFENEGQRETFAGVVDLNELKVDGLTEANVSGELENRAGAVSLRFETDCRMTYLCDRCLKECETDLRYSFSHKVERSLQNEDNEDYVLVPDETLDIDPIVREDILLELPSKLLCSPECKGLCGICGKNLNEGDCGCKNDDTDPRLAVLKDLLK